MPNGQVGPVPLALTDEELACQLQVEEVAAKAHQGRDVATLELVMEATGQLTYSQPEGLGVPTIQAAAPPLGAGPS